MSDVTARFQPGEKFRFRAGDKYGFGVAIENDRAVIIIVAGRMNHDLTRGNIPENAEPLLESEILTYEIEIALKAAALAVDR